MRIQWIPLIIALIINIAADYYIFQNLAKAFKQQWVKWLHGALSAILLVYIIVAVALPRRSIDNDGLVAIMWMLYSYFTFYVPKYIAIIVYWLCRIPCYLRKIKSKIPAIASVLAGIFIFINMWWGVLVTRYDYNIEEVTLQFDNLPDNFDGYRITQFSDLHVGSYASDTSYVAEIVNVINKLQSDVIFFTGDLVNRQTDEAEPFVEVLSRLQAHDGVFSILGNHDYGDYMEWPSPEAKAEWGEPPFSQYGDLVKAHSELNDSNFKILLSHNPKHWRSEVLPSTNIDLTLSGHTHAMQIMVNFFGIKISPSAWIYPEWAGTYCENKQILYVNIGIGEVAMPMRIGATPEITVLTLKKEQKL